MGIWESEFFEKNFSPWLQGDPQNCQKVAFSVVARPPKAAREGSIPLGLGPPLEARPQQKTQLFGNSEGLGAIRAKSSSQKTLIHISPKVLEHPKCTWLTFGRIKLNGSWTIRSFKSHCRSHQFICWGGRLQEKGRSRALRRDVRETVPVCHGWILQRGGFQTPSRRTHLNLYGEGKFDTLISIFNVTTKPLTLYSYLLNRTHVVIIRKGFWNATFCSPISCRTMELCKII